LEEDNSLSRIEIHQIACKVEDGEADPEEVRKLLEFICTLVDREESLPPEVLKYIRDSFRSHLGGSKMSLDRTFGVTRKRGRPKVDRGRRIEMASEILRLRLSGENHEDAVVRVGAMFSKESTVINEAWRDHKFEAVWSLRSERSINWTDKKFQQLDKIYAKESWYIVPGKDRNKP